MSESLDDSDRASGIGAAAPSIESSFELGLSKESRMRRLILLSALTLSVLSFDWGYSCTIFMAAKGGRALAGNGEFTHIYDVRQQDSSPENQLKVLPWQLFWGFEGSPRWKEFR